MQYQTSTKSSKGEKNKYHWMGSLWRLQEKSDSVKPEIAIPLLIVKFILCNDPSQPCLISPTKVFKDNCSLISFSLYFVFSLLFCIILQCCNLFISIFWEYGMNYLSFPYFLWWNSLWSINALDYSPLPGMNYGHTPKLHCIY